MYSISDVVLLEMKACTILIFVIVQLQQFSAQLEQLQQKVADHSEAQQCTAKIKKLRKEYKEMKKVILDAQKDYDDTRVILKDITQKLAAIDSDKL